METLEQSAYRTRKDTNRTNSYNTYRPPPLPPPPPPPRQVPKGDPLVLGRGPHQEMHCLAPVAPSGCSRCVIDDGVS